MRTGLQLCGGFTRAYSTDLQVLVVEGTTISRPDPPGGHVSVWASPWSNKFMRWTFMKHPSELARIYAGIPTGTDILVSYQSPQNLGDHTFNWDSGKVEHVGSRTLLRAIERIRPN